MVPLPLTLSSPIMVIPNQPSITTQLESRLDAQDEKIELLSTQVPELNLSMKKIFSELPRSIEKLIAGSVPPSKPVTPPENQPPITTQLQSKFNSNDENSTQSPDSSYSPSLSLSEHNRIAIDYIEQYINKYKVSCALIPNLSADQAIEIFISGLENDIGNWLRILNPESCDRAMDLARHVAIATAHGGNTISRRNTIIEWKASASVDRKGNPNSKGSRAYSSCSSERPNYCNEKASPITSPCYQSMICSISDFNIDLDSSVSAKHGENVSTMAGFDVQAIGKQLAYIVSGETKFNNLKKKNKTAAGMSVAFLGENMVTGFKVEDQITLPKQYSIIASVGTVRFQSDSAYGANVEIQRRELDYPIAQLQSTLGLSIIKWRGDLAFGFNSLAQFSAGHNSKVVVSAGINNKMSGQISVNTSSSQHFALALAAVIPLVYSAYKKLWIDAREK